MANAGPIIIQSALIVAVASLGSCKSRDDLGGLTGAPRRESNPGEPGSGLRANPAHVGTNVKFTVAGFDVRLGTDEERHYQFDFAPEPLKDRYSSSNFKENRILHQALPPFRFGTYELTLPSNGIDPVESRLIRDMHYHLGNDKVGIRPIPVSDRDTDGRDTTNTTNDGLAVHGSKIVDAYLRREMKLRSEDPIFALIAYMHPEEFAGDLKRLTSESLKLEGGHTHLGAYLGDGRTRNAPVDYHGKTWGVTAYPANITVVSLTGAPQHVFNTNAHIALRLLNEGNAGGEGEGLQFPIDYKHDPLEAINLKETLDFYRGWIDPEWVREEDKRAETDPQFRNKPFHHRLKNDPRYATYCAEHIFIALNIALNVPQNIRGYTEVWGEDGPALFAKAKDLWNKISRSPNHPNGEGMPDVPYFEPLWRQSRNELGEREIRKPLHETRIGLGLAWSPETTVDLIVNFVDQYASWLDVGVPTSAAVALGFAPEVMKRLGLSAEQFLDEAVPIIQKMVMHEAMTIRSPRSRHPFKNLPSAETSLEAYASYVQEGLRLAASHTQKQIEAVTGSPAPDIQSRLVEPSLAKLRTLSGKSMDIEPLTAWSQFQRSIADDLIQSRQKSSKPAVDVLNNQLPVIQYYTTPAVIQRITANMYKSHPLVHIRTVATAMDAPELKLSLEAVEYDIYQALPQPEIQTLDTTPAELLPLTF